jgi:hypothetical protein
VDWSEKVYFKNIFIKRDGKPAHSQKEKKVILEDRIEKILRMGSGVEVYFHWNPLHGKANTALKSAGEFVRFELTMDLFRLWLERSEETKSVFFELLRHERGKEVFYSLTADGRQLRVWFDKPDIGRVRPDHVDSMGRGLLFEVLGPPPAVRQYLEGLLNIKPLAEKVLRYQTKFYE